MGKYDNLIEFMLNHHGPISYNDLYLSNEMVDAYRRDQKKNLDFNNKQIRLLTSIDNAIKSGDKIEVVDQEEEFIHIFVNGNNNNLNKYRLYLSPARENLLPLVVEIINRSLANGQQTYFKYAQKPYRLDQLLFYLKDNDDIRAKLHLLAGIKKERPELFQSMFQAPCWICGTSLPDVFIAPNASLTDRLGRKSSYGHLFAYALNDTKQILEYFYGVRTNDSLKRFKTDSSFSHRFETIFEEMLVRYGIFLQLDRKGNYNITMAQGNKWGEPVSEFYYNKNNGILTERRHMDDQSYQEWPFGQDPKSKAAFKQYIFRCISARHKDG